MKNSGYGACDICNRPARLAALKTCNDCDRTFDDHCSALREAEAGGFWAEEHQTFPPEWGALCRICFGKWAEGMLTCPACGQRKAKRKIFWGGPCTECGGYVCYECVRGKKTAGGGWEAPQGLWAYKCRRHTGLLAFGWQKLTPPGHQKG